MALEHEKSLATLLLDNIRYLLILAASCYAVILIWRWNWIVALIAAIPVFKIMWNLVGFLTFPLYLFTSEGKALRSEFTEKSDVKVPEDTGSEPPSKSS